MHNKIDMIYENNIKNILEMSADNPTLIKSAWVQFNKLWVRESRVKLFDLHYF